MPTPVELREESRVCREAARAEFDPYFKRLLASHALAVAQLAEKIERAQQPTKISSRYTLALGQRP